MINYKQLESYIESLYSSWPSCSNATLGFMMCAGHESKGGEFIFQDDGNKNMYDKALGVLQIEKPTHDDILFHAPNAYSILFEKGYQSPDWKFCLHDIKYSALIFRLQFMRYNHKFPSDPVRMSEYLKKYWNTEAGKATPEKYYNDWREWRGKIG